MDYRKCINHKWTSVLAQHWSGWISCQQWLFQMVVISAGWMRWGKSCHMCMLEILESHLGEDLCSLGLSDVMDDAVGSVTFGINCLAVQDEKRGFAVEYLEVGCLEIKRISPNTGCEWKYRYEDEAGAEFFPAQTLDSGSLLLAIISLKSNLTYRRHSCFTDTFDKENKYITIDTLSLCWILSLYQKHDLLLVLNSFV